MADNEPHAVVRLLLKRMESNPEEFRVGDAPFHDRWYDHVNAIQAFGSEADKAAMTAGLREIRLAETHERVMDELLNGPERRRMEEEEREYERQLIVQQARNTTSQLTAQQMMQQAQGALNGAYANQLSQSLGQLKQASAQGLVGKSYTSAIMDEYDADLDMYRTPTGHLPVANGGTGSTITNTINQIKRKLGAKK